MTARQAEPAEAEEPPHMDRFKVPGRCYCGTPCNPETSILGHERGTGRCLYRKYQKPESHPR